jgi:hypothetical protein
MIACRDTDSAASSTSSGMRISKTACVCVWVCVCVGGVGGEREMGGGVRVRGTDDEAGAQKSDTHGPPFIALYGS